jgi:microsomal dipeptidase-like Zn-dependent dipeptidase
MIPAMPFVDLHAHFPMHHEIPDDPGQRMLFDSLNRTLNYELFEPRVSLKRWFKDNPEGGVTGFGSVLHDPQDDFFVHEFPVPKAFDHIREQMRRVEDEIREDGRVQIARTPRQVENFLSTNQKFMFHTLEGGFSLGGDPANVEVLADLGVAAIIPAHLFYRGVATCENGFPPVAHLLFLEELAKQPCFGLHPLGTAIVEACFRRGVLVDVTHARSDAQKDIFEIAAGYPDRPLISSHTAVRGICDAGLNLSNDAIKTIQKSQGIIGVIFYKQWLHHALGPDLRDDFRLISDVIDYLKCVTGTYENIGIGSDLDGFIEPIGMCSNYSKMSALTLPLMEKYGQATAEEILFRNALRVLHAGWKGIPE